MLVRNALQAKGRRLIQIAPEATVAEAIGRLDEHNIGSLPVVDEAGRLVGIFTERDVLRGVHADCEGFHRARIADVMTPSPITCQIEDNVQTVMAKMSDHQVGQLPVLDGDRLVGVISVGDVIKLLYEQVEAENKHLLEYLYGH